MKTLKGEKLIECLAREFKDEWVTAHQVSNKCNRGRGYTRDILETYSAHGVVEKKEEGISRKYYRIDPEDGEIICPADNKPYEESICKSLGDITETLVKLREEYESCGYCDEARQKAEAINQHIKSGEKPDHDLNLFEFSPPPLPSLPPHKAVEAFEAILGLPPIQKFLNDVGYEIGNQIGEGLKQLTN